MPLGTTLDRSNEVPEDIAARLEAVDWGFTASRTADPLESIHPYPAKFIPAIPGTLLDLLPIPDDSYVLDPFVGSGTTLVESQRRGYRSLGVDINPIACLISSVKTAPTPTGLIDCALDITSRAHLWALDKRRHDIPNIDHWFARDVQSALAHISEDILDAPPVRQDALNLALSSIVVKVSNQESDTRYAAIQKKVRGTDVGPLFLTAVERIDAALRSRGIELVPAEVIEGDAQLLTPRDLPERVGAIITSPPYPNAYEYWLYHKYRMYWLRRDPLSVRNNEIGARPHFFKKDPHTPRHFFDQMRNVFGAAAANLVPDGWLCVVVGRSRIAGRDIDNASMIGEVADHLGLVREADITRQISASRKSFNLSHARIKTESILVYRRP